MDGRKLLYLIATFNHLFEMFCTKYGKKITSGEEFCGYCRITIPITPEQQEIRD